jgi:hypothetical protein
MLIFPKVVWNAPLTVRPDESYRTTVLGATKHRWLQRWMHKVYNSIALLTTGSINSIIAM